MNLSGIKLGMFMMLTLIVSSSCVPKASDKKAVCGTNQAFDNVSRSCYSIAEIRYKPVGTKSTETLSQETAKTITLTYTDKNNDQALSCKISSVSSNLEIMSPLILSGTLFTRALEVEDAGNDLADLLVAILPAGVDETAVLNAQTAMTAALNSARTTYSHAKIIAQLGVFKTQLAAITAYAINYPANTSVQFFNTLITTRLAVLNTLLTSVDNRCECAAGTCTTTIIPKINESGTAGFAYTITDSDGESESRAVTATITAMSKATSHLKPVAESDFFSYVESSSSTASTYSVAIPGGADLFGSTSFTYSFAGSKNGSNQGITTAGLVSGCMDLTGSTGLNDTSCAYTPNDGDAFDTAVVNNADVVIGDLTYEALIPGTYGNNITVQYFNLQNSLISVDPYLTKTQLFGMVSTFYNESFVRVVGNAIKVFINPGITSSENIRDMLTAHPQASKLVSVTGGGAATFPVPATVTPAAVPLTGGVDAFDTIPFTINNGFATSENSAKVGIKVTTADDAPVMNFVAATSATALEDTAIVTIDLSPTFSDVDTDGAIYTNVCNVNPADAVFLGNFTVNSCTCVISTCTLSLSPNANVSSTTAYTFSYRIGSYDGTSYQYTAYRNYSLTMTPVNDEPQLSSVALPVITPVADQTIAESTSTVPNSGFVDVYIGTGGSGFETSQTLTLTATSSDTTLLPAANLVITTPSAGVRRITYTPVVNKSGTTNIELKLKDDGGTTNGGDDEVTDTFQLTVTAVDDPPYFLSSFAKAETNEGGQVVTDGMSFDEDMGSSSDEDAQGVVVSALTSDNTAVLPTSAITMFYDLNDNGIYDSGESRAVGVQLESAAGDDVKLHKLHFKITPISGVSGNANVSVTISDGTSTAVKSFSLVVYPVAALHGGWENISAIGLKTDKDGAPVSETEFQCNYNRATDTKSCGGSNCTGTASPHGVIVPDAANVLFYDSSAKRCYRSTGTTEFTWVELRTTCPITRATGVCSDNNCIATAAPTPTAKGQFYFNTTANTCHISTGTTAGSWEDYIPAKITLTWKNFTIAGSGADAGVQIAGWNVYRRERNEDYNFKGGHLKNTSSTTTYTITDPGIRTFTDTTAVAGKLYFYLVRPVDNRHIIPTHTPEIFSEVRVLAPTPNYVYVHRWMINQEICNSMNMTTSTTNRIDPTANFRCPYSGPGGSGGYYDYGEDLLVDMQEMGCPYSPAPKCSANGCIGIGAPPAHTVAGDIYYDRSSANCYINDGATWRTMDTAAGVAQITSAISDKLRSALNAPLAQVTQAQAVSICTARGDQDGLYTGVSGAITPKLPSKKDYVAYSAFPLNKSDAEISDLEQGFSLDVESRCNSSSASGLETAFTDSAIPSTSFMYTLAGTSASGIRSLVTGSIPHGSSKSTEACVSRYGVQDIFGNVTEWTTDQMSCANKVCAATATSSMYYDFDPGAGSKYYAFDNVTGPYSDTDLDTVVDSAGDAYITDWLFADEFFEAGKFSLPTSMPISNNVAINNDTDNSPAIPFLLDIGPSSGITNSKLHDDGFVLNGDDLDGATGSMTAGGSFIAGSWSGRWFTEVLPTTRKDVDIGFRCIVPVPKTQYPADTAHTYPY